jgi:hypothetical protein
LEGGLVSLEERLSSSLGYLLQSRQEKTFELHLLGSFVVGMVRGDDQL